MNISTGSFIDELVSYNQITRISYGFDVDKKPNDHCYWDSDFGWVENDEHLKQRIKQNLVEK